MPSRGGRQSAQSGSPASTPVLGRDAGGLRIELVRTEAGSAEPFVVLYEGRHTRLLLAELVAGEGEVVRRFVLKVRSDVVAPRAPGHGRALTNPDVDEAWQREVGDLAKVESAQVVARVPVPPELLASAPVTYCQRTQRYFHPVCAVTGEVLRTCKDDEWLLDCGLVKYSSDTWRYVSGGSGSRTFYRVPGANSERPRDGVTVRIGAQLHRDWAQLVHAAEGDAARERAAAVLPCVRCEHRHDCFPVATAVAMSPSSASATAAAAGPIPAEEQLQVVTFHDFEAVALELLDFDYDDLCDLLGGAELAEVVASAMPPVQARRELMQRRGAALVGPGQWLFGGDPMRFPLEVLRQKLSAFASVVEGVRALHAATGRPHFAVAPANVMASLQPAVAGTPVRWGFQVRLLDFGSALRFTAPGLASSTLPPLLEPGAELREDLRMRAYQAPELQAVDGQTVSMLVQVRRAAGTSADQVRLQVEAQGAANLKQFRPGDVVCVMPSNGTLQGELTLWASLSEVKPRGLSASALVPTTHPCLRWEGKSVDARLAFFRHFGPPVDLYGLGMLLFRTLLVNDGQSMEDVEEVVGKCLRRLKDELSGLPVDDAMVQRRLQHHLHGKDVRARFERAQVLFRGEARAEFAQQVADGSAPIDAGIWQSLLRIAFKLTTQLSGFSYSTSYADGSPFLLRQVKEDVEALRRRVHVDLFAAADRDRALAAALEQVLEELRNELLAGGGDGTRGDARVAAVPAPARGFRLVLEKEGDPAVQELGFDQEQVTIGRKEVDNLVRLQDPMVSSAHAVIELQEEGWVVIDRNSRNGTEVDGVRIPVDVPVPLQDGTVLTIRPFTLTFRSGGGAGTTAAQRGRPNLEMTTVVESLSGEQIGEQLQSEYARCQQAPPAQQHEALRQVLVRARSAAGADELHQKLEPLLRQFARSQTIAAEAPAPAAAPAFFAAAHKALQQLAKALVGQDDFRSADEVAAFATKLRSFVDATCTWIEQAIAQRREFVRVLEAGGRSTGGGLRGTAAEVRQLVLGPTGAATAEVFLSRFYAEVMDTLHSLLKTPDSVRKAVRDKLDPARLAAQASSEKKGFFGADVATSPLWKLFLQNYNEVTDDKSFELSLEVMMRKSLEAPLSRP
jgi:pSer/pThr/pTyr-binding forkhead associated (FHA) protein